LQHVYKENADFCDFQHDDFSLIRSVETVGDQAGEMEDLQFSFATASAIRRRREAFTDCLPSDRLVCDPDSPSRQ